MVVEVQYSEPAAVRRRAPRAEPTPNERTASETELALEQAALSNPQLRAIKREVEQLGAAQLQGRAKKAWEKREVKSMGIRERKGIKTPLPMLAGMRKMQHKRDAQAEAAALESGTGDHLHLRKKRKLAKASKEKPRDLGVSASVGKFTGGVLKIDSQDVEQIKSSARTAAYDKLVSESRDGGGGRGGRGRGRGGGGRGRGGRGRGGKFNKPKAKGSFNKRKRR